MKRFPVQVGVQNLDASIRFYSALFGAEPTVRKAAVSASTRCCA